MGRIAALLLAMLGCVSLQASVAFITPTLPLSTRTALLGNKGAARERSNNLALSLSSQSEAPTFLILPGFGNAAVDYVNPFGQGEELSISSSLSKRGIEVEVMPLDRIEWLNVLRGVFTLSFWLGKTTPYEPAYGWYVERARETLSRVSQEAGARGVVIVGHSAGGWLGRAVVGDGEWIGDEKIKALVTLGAPHFPPPSDEYPDVKDMTQGALTYTHEMFPGAHVKDFGIACVSVGSSGIRGNDQAERGTPERSAHASYRMVCGQGDVVGDGVVPLSSCHLEGADEITMSCYHSISPVGGPYEETRGVWYGSDAVVDEWLNTVWKATGVSKPSGN